MKVHRKKILSLKTAHSEAHAPVDKKPNVVETRISINDKATKRVIAPFVRIVRKGQKLPVSEAEDTQFSLYLQKKPSVLIRDLSSFISDSVDLSTLLHDSADVLKKITKASGVTLYMIDPATNEIFLNLKSGTLERFKIRWKIRDGTTIAAYVANRKEYVMVDDILLDERFPEGIGYEGEAVKSVLCVPIVTPDEECFAIIELYRQLFDDPFTDDDLSITIVVTGWMGAAIHQNQKRLALKRQQELNDYLLDLTKCYFSETVLMEKMIVEVIKFAKVTLRAERASFFIIDRDSDELVADLFDEGTEEKDASYVKKSTKVRFGKERGIASLVAKTGVSVNVKDAYNDSRFNKEIDQKTGYITRSILCMPVLGMEGILGVLQVINKQNGGYFTNTDEILFKTFSVYCALALHYTRISKTMKNTSVLNNCYLKMLRLQQKPCIHDFEELAGSTQMKIPNDFHTFRWYIGADLYDKIPQLCLYMFTKIIPPRDINRENLMKFILSAKKLYRDVPYHNFEHAFNVLHCMYNILFRNLRTFSQIELKSLMVAAIGHDLDHGGFSNNFLQLTKNDLAQLYEESFLENHHYDVTMFILQDLEIFSNLSKEDYELMSKEIKDAILATDLALHFITRTKLQQLLNNKIFDWTKNNHRRLAKSIMMTSCDLSGLCKPFLAAKKITDNLYREFYLQGDLEKQMGLCPLSTMDREKQHSVPEDQVQFLTIIVIPCVNVLFKTMPSTEDLYVNATLLRETWQDVIDGRGKKCWRQDDSLVADLK